MKWRTLTCSCLIYAASLGAEAYQVHVEGVEDRRVESLFFEVSQLAQHQDQEPVTYALLYHRAQEDAEQLVKVLHAYGYYSARVTFEIVALPQWSVVLHVIPGPAYALNDLFVVTTDGTPLSSARLDIPLGRPLQSRALIESEEELRHCLSRQSYPLAQVVSRRITADATQETASAEIVINPGPFCRFGPVQISGTQGVDPNFILNSLWWQPGMPYSDELIRQTQEELEASELFTTVAITHGKEVLDCDELPMSIAVTEGKSRSIGLALSYSTYDHWGGTISWVHRNLRGRGQQLLVDVEMTQKLQEVTTQVIWPHWKRPHQTLTWSFDLARDQTPAYLENTAAMDLYAERRFSYWLTGRFGAELNVMRATQSNDDRRFWLLGLPASLNWDRSDYIRTPHHGWLIDLELRPYLDLDSAYPMFSRQSATAILFYAFDRDQTFVLVPSFHIGSIAGASEVNVPPPLRFYAGNARYLRGYNYMTVSPLNDDNHPIGGRSILVASIEPRVRLTKKLDYVIYTEWGNVFFETLPQFNRKLLRSIAIGARYHTLVGPLRLDVAFPLDPRPDIDKPLQVYFSVGASY